MIAPAVATSAGHRLPAAGSPVLAPVGSFFFKFRDLLFPAVFFGLALASRPAPPFGSWALDRALDGLGILAALSGQALRAAVIGLAYIRRGGRDKRVYADSLVQEGIFAHSRNPLYLGNFLALAGFCLVHDSPLCYLVGIPFFAFAYLAIVTAEEDYLRRRFGAAYDEYCRRVPRFLPRWAGLGQTLRGMEFDWRRLVRKEYGSTFAGLSTILALLAWGEVLRRGWPAARGAALALGALWLPLAAAYLLAFRLKKTGALG